MTAPVPMGLKRVHPLTVTRGENASLWDDSGREYIDFVGGIGVLVTGHRHPRIVEAAKAQIDQLTHVCFNATPHAGYLKLAEKLNTIVPIHGDCRTMLTNSGAEAWENALKVSRVKTGRTGVLAFEGGFHGRTLATLALNGKAAPYKSGLGPLPGPVLHTPYASTETGVSAEEALAALSQALSISTPPETIGAVAIEPVQGEGGFATADPDFLRGLRTLCDQHGWLLIVDEVQSGWYRTGKRFALEHSDVEADIVIMAKGLAGGFPLGALTGKAEVMDSVTVGGLGGTYSGNPVAVAAALAVLEVLEDEDFAGKSAALEDRIQTHHAVLSRAFPGILGPLRGRGAMRAFGICDSSGHPSQAASANVIATCRENGLLLMPSGKAGELIRLLPPLSIPMDQFDRGFGILRDALTKVA